MHGFLLFLLLLIPPPPPGQAADPEALWGAGERLRALAAWEAALERSPDDHALRARLVRADLEAARFEAALRHAEGLPPEHHGLRGEALYFLARYEEALESLGQDPRGRRLAAECLWALGRLEALEAALPALRTALGAEALEVRRLEARLLLQRGEDRAALPLLRELLTRDPLDAEAGYALGRALVRAGEREEGLALLERHRALAPLLDALDFARRGVALAPLGASNQAALAEAWQALAPFDPGALERAAEAHGRALALAAGEELVPVALRAARFEAEARGSHARAAALLAEALARHEDVRLRVRRADHLAAAGERDAARAELRRALERRPGDRAILERLARLEGPEAR